MRAFELLISKLRINDFANQFFHQNGFIEKLLEDRDLWKIFYMLPNTMIRKKS